MRILHTVEFYEPRKGGAEEVVKQLSQRLVKLGHEVTVATSYVGERSANKINGVDIQSFRISGNHATGIHGQPAEVRRYQDFITGNYDIILNYAAQSWTSDLALEVIHRSQAKKVFVPCGYSGLFNPAYQEYFATLPKYLALYDSLVYMSRDYQDATFGKDHGLSKKAVYIPNGASEEEFDTPATIDFKKMLDIKTKYMALCVGNHYVAKGHQFVIAAFEAMKRNDTTLVIIGQAKVSTGIKKIGHFILDFCRCLAKSVINRRIKLYTGSSRAAVIAAFKQADLFLFGSRVECAPLVIYESFASKTPCISTPVGNVTDYKDYLFIARTPMEMATIANSLLHNDDQRLEVAERAHALWKKQYTWAKIALQYETLFNRLTHNKNRVYE